MSACAETCPLSHSSPLVISRELLVALFVDVDLVLGLLCLPSERYCQRRQRGATFDVEHETQCFSLLAAAFNAFVVHSEVGAECMQIFEPVVFDDVLAQRCAVFRVSFIRRYAGRWRVRRCSGYCFGSESRTPCRRIPLRPPTLGPIRRTAPSPSRCPSGVRVLTLPVLP